MSYNVHFFCTFILLSFISNSCTVLVTWAPNRSFNLPSSFKDGNAPCSKKKVVIPESVQEYIQIESTLAVSQLILPSDGVIVFAEGSTVLFGEDPSDVNCTSDISYYVDDSSSAWNIPGVWNSSKFNKATPDAERLPCYDDNVVFPESAQFTIQLPDSTQYVNQLSIGGRNLTTETFMDRVHRPSESDGIQMFVLGGGLNNNPLVVRSGTCKSTAGCPCQANGLRINCNLKYCATPKCANPIKPVGHCCKVCGGSLLFEIDNFSMRAFKKLVRSIVNSYGAENFEYHIGMLPLTDPDTLKTMPKRIQVIVMDKEEYTGASSELINEIGYQMAEEWTKNEKLIHLSGSPDSETGLAGKIAVSMFFAVVIAMGVLFGYYYRRSEFKLPEFRGGVVGASVLSRFQRRSDSLVTLTRRDSSISGLRENVGGTAFRNPLYDSKRGRVVVTESNLEE